MGREVRRVPPDWQHPVEGKYPDGSPRHVPLYDGSDYETHLRWHKKAKAENRAGGEPLPNKRDYMPIWTPGEATHYMMYETCSEGTPISPAFATPEELARWLADTGASAFGSETASYEGWLRVTQGRPSIGAVLYVRPDQSGEWVSGVDAQLEREQARERNGQ